MTLRIEVEYEYEEIEYIEIDDDEEYEYEEIEYIEVDEDEYNRGNLSKDNEIKAKGDNKINNLIKIYLKE